MTVEKRVPLWGALFNFGGFCFLLSNMRDDFRRIAMAAQSGLRYDLPASIRDLI
jgi:hypothetical protein